MIQAIDQTEEISSSPAGEDVSSGDFLSILMRRKWVIVLFALLGCGLGYLMYIKTPPLYRSSAQILVVIKNPVVPIRSINMMGTDQISANVLATQAVVLTSPKVVGEAVKDGKIFQFRSMANVSPEAVVGTVMNGITVARGGDSTANGEADVLNVSYTGSDPQDCQAIVSTILDSYRDFLSKNRDQYSKDVITLISGAKDSLYDLWEKKNKEYAEWRQAITMPLFITQNHENIHWQRLANYENERALVGTRKSEIEATIKILEEAQQQGVTMDSLVLLIRNTTNVTPTQQSINNTNDIIQKELLPLMIQEQMLTQKFGPDHPSVKTVRLSMRVLQDLLLNRGGEESGTSASQFLNIYLESKRQELKILDDRDRRLVVKWETEREAARSALNFEERDKRLQEEIESIKRLYNAAVERLREMELQDPGGMEVQLLSSPGPGYQVQPIFQRSLAIGAVLGILLGVGLAYLIDLADKSFRTPDEIRGQLKLPVIGHIPVIEPPSRRDRKKRPAGPPSKVGEMVVCHHRPRSTVSEAYRQIRTALYFGSGGEEHKVIQVTSADAGDGKTTLAINLAVSIAQSGKRVCLVDADFRRSRIHEEFGLERMHGISSVMAGKEELTDAIQSTEIENLSILSSGPRASNPAELLTSHRFKELLDVLRSKFDTIIIDTPPLLAVTDPCAVAPRVDCVVLVLRITKNVKPNAMRAKQVLDGLGAKVIGIVVNGVEINAGYGHDSGYRRYSSAGGYGAGYGYRDYTYGSYYSEEQSDATEIHIPSHELYGTNGKSNDTL